LYSKLVASAWIFLVCFVNANCDASTNEHDKNTKSTVVPKIITELQEDGIRFGAELEKTETDDVG
jgi:hypothetical protein